MMAAHKLMFLPVLVFLCGHARAQTSSPQVFLVEDDIGRQWCSYTNAKDRNARAEKVHADTYGALTYTGATLTEIEITHEDKEGGDWTVIDRYRLGTNGQIVKLTRRLNVLSAGDRSVIQTFLVSGARARKISTSERDLRTGRPLRVSRGMWLPEIPIWPDIKKLPFAPLLTVPWLQTANQTCFPDHHL